MRFGSGVLPVPTGSKIILSVAAAPLMPLPVRRRRRRSHPTRYPLEGISCPVEESGPKQSSRGLEEWQDRVHRGYDRVWHGMCSEIIPQADLVSHAGRRSGACTIRRAL